MTDDLPRWRENLRQRFKETEVPPELTDEVACYQQCSGSLRHSLSPSSRKP